MGRLGGGVNDNGRLEIFDQAKDVRTISNIEFVMIESRKTSDESLLIPTSIALRAEKGFTLVVIHTMNDEPIFVEKPGNFRADQTGRTCDET